MAAFRSALALAWLVFHMYIMFEPLHPMVARSTHVFIAIVAAFLWQPLG